MPTGIRILVDTVLKLPSSMFPKTFMLTNIKMIIAAIVAVIIIAILNEKFGFSRLPGLAIA